MLKTIAVLAFLALASAVEFDECPGIIQPVEVRVTGCDALPCLLQKGSTVVVETDGAPDADIHGMFISADVIWDGTAIGIPLNETDACKLLAPPATCPIEEGVIVTFRSEFVIPTYLPQDAMRLRFQVHEEHKHAVAKPVAPRHTFQCFEVDIVITA